MKFSGKTKTKKKKTPPKNAQSAGTAEYTDYISAEG